MKVSIKKLVLGSALIISLIFTGCSNFDLTDAKVNQTNSGKCIVPVSINNFPSTRQINPEQFAKDDLKKITIQGKSSSGYSLEEKELDFTSGTATVALEYDLWELTLTAYKDTEGTLPVLSGNTYIDISNGGTKISFSLSTTNVTTEGDVKLSCKYILTSNNADVTKITAGLYNRLTKETILDKNGNSTEINFEKNDEKTFEYEVSNVAPGDYTFMITFYGNSKIIGNYSDILQIAPGNITKGELTIPDVILKKPEAPTNLKAFYVKNSETNDYYKLDLIWEDNSNNEDNFIITIFEYTENDDSTPSVYKILGIEDDIDNEKEVFFTSNPTRVSGSILANNKEATLRLPTGKLFDISIQAQNYAGTSDYCNRVSSVDDAREEQEGIDIANNKRINKTSIYYSFPNATLLTESKPYFGGYTEYKEWPDDNGTKKFSLLEIKTIASGEKPTLVENGHEWQRWLNSSKTEATEHTTYNNATYTADFNLSYLVEYDIKDFDTFADDAITATDTSGNDVAGSSVKNDEEITIKITGDYESYQIDFDGRTRYYGEDNEYKLSAGINITGTKTITIMAKIKNTEKWVGKAITVTFEN